MKILRYLSWILIFILFLIFSRLPTYNNLSLSIFLTLLIVVLTEILIIIIEDKRELEKLDKQTGGEDSGEPIEIKPYKKSRNGKKRRRTTSIH